MQVGLDLVTSANFKSQHQLRLDGTLGISKIYSQLLVYLFSNGKPGATEDLSPTASMLERQQRG